MKFIKTKGFTLIELLVVVSIISLLTSVVLASLNDARAKARDTKRIEDLRQINIAIQLYIQDNKAAPFYNDTATPKRSRDSSWDDLQTVLSPYMPTLPHDPLDGKLIPGGPQLSGSYLENERLYTYYYQIAAGHGDTCPGDPSLAFCGPTAYVLGATGFETSGKNVNDLPVLLGASYLSF